MTAFSERIGDTRLNLAQKHADLDRHNAATMKRIAQETGDTPITTTARATPAGDEQRLRGVPVVGRGIMGAIPGTTP